MDSFPLGTYDAIRDYLSDTAQVDNDVIADEWTVYPQCVIENMAVR